MQIIAISNLKGGCAKTTTSVNLAAGLALEGKRVLLVDLDPQGNASEWLGVGQQGEGSFELLTGDQPLDALIHGSSVQGVSCISGSGALSKLERTLAKAQEPERYLKTRLAPLRKQQWDVVILDTPPTLGLLTLNALTVAHQLLVPVTTQVLSLSGVAQLMQTVDQVREQLNPRLSLLGLVACRVNLRTLHSQDVVQALMESFGEKLLKTHIRENIRLAEAPSFNKSIFQYSPKSGASEDYRSLAREVLSLIK